jgi:hypothetical protein
MKRLTWARVMAGITLAYGIFLIIQGLLPVWPTEQAHNLAMLIGGILLIPWAAIFWKLK